MTHREKRRRRRARRLLRAYRVRTAYRWANEITAMLTQLDKEGLVE